ncbi:MAG TPA: hypothetical protein PKA28_07720 [Methylomusa anaerophila]|uniref:Uncharacterized protein n=1 Tax=Methylomusa anaerophila TaxID=1930071 RepID=A0A348AFV6_9FIRM|nr:hypothetical protein [Methylomusa anaerophila]BBB89954.1 hypothetical protein MAMMFC1_00594 [Methylomusa anaerophila]HML88319.1 hypothetical protein [Methylomusa anaerophila]
MPRKTYYDRDWEDPEIEDWEYDYEDREYNSRQRCAPLLAIVAVTAAYPLILCAPRRYCSPRNPYKGMCYPYYSCSPTFGCIPIWYYRR